MKKYSIALVLLSFNFFVSAQDLYVSSLDSHTEIDLPNHSKSISQPLRYSDCPIQTGFEISECTLEKINHFLTANLTYPELGRDHGVEGRCKIIVEVNEIGKASKVVLQECDETVFGPTIERALSNLSLFPAYQKGRPVKRIFTVFADFKL